MAAEYPMTEFQQYLAREGLGRSSQKQILTAIRRVVKHVGPERLEDRSELALYRLSLPESTNRIFVYSWSKLQAYMETIGEPLSDIPPLPRLRLVHPLWADLTDITARLNIHLIETMRWAGVKDADEELYVPALRVFEFITSRPPMDSDWLVPRDAGATEPMPYWMLDTILRTNATEDSWDTEKVIFGMLETATRRGISASQLREIWAQLESILGTPSVGRRIMKLDKALGTNPKNPWSPADQTLVLTALGVTVKPAPPKIDISGPIGALKEALSKHLPPVVP